jgi:hypothetical protein
MSGQHLQIDALPDTPGQLEEKLRELRELRVGDPGRGVYAAVREDQTWPALPKLERLDVLSHGLSTLDPFVNLSGLRVLYAAANRSLRDIEALRGMRKLEVLAIFKTAVASLEPLAGLPLRVVWAGFCRELRELRGLECPELQRISLVYDTKLESLDGIEGAPGLRHVAISHVRTMDLRPLGALRGLEVLEVRGVTFDATVSVFASLPSLRFLDLGGSSFQDPELLLAIPRLEEVRLGGTPIATNPDALARLHARRPELIVEVHAQPGPWSGLSVESLEESLELE